MLQETMVTNTRTSDENADPQEIVDQATHALCAAATEYAESISGSPGPLEELVRAALRFGAEHTLAAALAAKAVR